MLKSYFKCALRGFVAIPLLLAPNWLEAKNSKKAQSQNIEDELGYKSDEGTANDVRALKTELLVSRSEKKAHHQIQKLLRQYKGTSMEPEMWLRLAELYMRQAKTARFFELHKTGSDLKKLAPQQIKKASQLKLVRKAIKVYDLIEVQFPRFQNMDLVLFNNAFANQGINKNKKAKVLFTKLIKNYPDSNFIPDSYLSLGEMFFQEKSYKSALANFMEIKQYPDSRVYPYGLYKAAWTFYNLNNARSALKELEAVVAYGVLVQKNDLDRRLDLRKEALEDMALFFEDVYPSSQAYTYFAGHVGEFGVGPVLMKLAELYKRHSRHNDVNTVLNILVDRSPTSPYVPVALNELIWNFERKRDRKGAVKEIERLHFTCAKESDWSKSRKNLEQQGQNQNDLLAGFSIAAKTDCQQLLNKSALNLAGKWHRMWKKQREQAKHLAASAEKAYALYLERNPSGKDPNKARFNFAELLFENKKFREASKNYAIVAKTENNNQLKHNSGYASLLSLEKAVKDKWSEQDEQLFRSLAKVYLTRNPKGIYVIDVNYKVAFIAYDNKKYNEAKVIFKKIGAQKEKLDLALKSQDLYLDILNLQKSYTEMKEYSKSLLAGAQQTERFTKMKKIYQEAYFSEIQSGEDSLDAQETIKGYKKFALENKVSPLASKAWWNAVQLHYKVKDLRGGAEAAHRYAKLFSESEHVKDALLRSAHSFEQMGRLQEAGGVLLDLAKQDPTAARKWNLLAADYYAISRHKIRAREIYSKYAKTKDGAVDKAVFEKWQALEEFIGSKAELNKIDEIIVASGLQPQTSLAQLKIVEKLFASANYSEAFRVAKKVVGMTGDASNYAKAMARYYQGRILEMEFEKQSVKAKPERIALVLGIKTEKLEKAQSAYEGAMRYKVTKVSVMAMERLSIAYAQFSRDIRSMQLPSSVPEAEVLAFKTELDKLALPMEERSVETLAKALSQAKRDDLRDGTVAELQKTLNKLQFTHKDTTPVEDEAPQVYLPHIEEAST